MKKKKTHSTQKLYFGTIPRSEFYGIAVGYAIGLFLSAFLNLETQYQNLLLAAFGFGIGYWYDMNYCREEDAEEEDVSASDMDGEEEDVSAPDMGPEEEDVSAPDMDPE